MKDREREKTQTVAGKGVTTDKQTKYPSLSGDGGGGVANRRTNSGWQVHPDQTKEVKG